MPNYKIQLKDGEVITKWFRNRDCLLLYYGDSLLRYKHSDGISITPSNGSNAYMDYKPTRRK